MKRCPQCQFIHLDQDEFCDFDGTPLETADEADLTVPGNAIGFQKVTNQSRPPVDGKRKLLLVATGAVTIGALLTAGYLGLAGRFSTGSEEQKPHVETQPVTQPPVASLSLTPTPDPGPSPSPVTTPTPSVMIASPSRAEAARGVVSRSPVSTGNENAIGSGLVRIHLTNGATVEADEVWRTKEGIWYRRNGMVTLLKRERVRAIERTKPSTSQ